MDSWRGGVPRLAKEVIGFLPWLWGEAGEYLPWNSWGGTAHLEDKSAAREKYEERSNGWSDTATWGRWIDGERVYALEDARKAYLYATDAEGYWARIAYLWEGYAKTMSSIHPDQFAKIVSSLGVSADAASTYRDSRNWVGYVVDVVPKPQQFPWWIWAGGALVLWNTIRR